MFLKNIPLFRHSPLEYSAMLKLYNSTKDATPDSGVAMTSVRYTYLVNLVLVWFM